MKWYWKPKLGLHWKVDETYIKATLGFKSMKTAYATIKGFEIMRMFKKEKFEMYKYAQAIQGKIRIITDNLLAY